MYRTDNNVSISKYILDLIKNIKLNENIYQYSYNFDINKLNQFFNVDYINFGVDGIIRDLFYLNSNKTIYYETPNYMMIEKYAKTFNLKLTNFENADILYIAYPNGATLKFPNFETFEIKKYNKTVILDLSYYIYTCKDYTTFINFVEKCKELNYYVLFGASKILGLPGLRVGFCKCKNPEIFNIIHQPWQISSPSKLILDEIWKPNIINKHIEIIKNSKEYFYNKYKSFIQFNTDGPYIAFNLDFKDLQTRNYEKYLRFSVIDKDLIKY